MKRDPDLLRTILARVEGADDFTVRCADLANDTHHELSVARHVKLLEEAGYLKANLLTANLLTANLLTANLLTANLLTANLLTANLLTANLLTAEGRGALSGNIERRLSRKPDTSPPAARNSCHVAPVKRSSQYERPPAFCSTAAIASSRSGAGLTSLASPLPS